MCFSIVVYDEIIGTKLFGRIEKEYVIQKIRSRQNILYYVFARFGAFMAVVTIQAGDADSSGAPGFTTDPLTEPVAF